MQKNTVVGLVISLLIGMLSACDFLQVPDNGPVIAGKKIERVDFTQQEHEAMQQILTLQNPIVKDLVYSYDKLAEEVILIGSPSEWQALCPDSVQAPVIDFERHCLIFGMVATPATQSEVRLVELYCQDNGEATFYTEILSTSVDGKVGLAFPYAVFDIPADRINQLEILARNRFY